MTTSRLAATHSSKDITAAIELLQEIRKEPLQNWTQEGLSKLNLAIDCLDDCLCEATQREEAETDEARRGEEDRVVPYTKYTGSGAGR